MKLLSERRDRSFPTVLSVFALGTTLLAMTCFIAEYICKHFLNLDRLPYDRPTLAILDDYADTWLFGIRFRHFHQSSFFSPDWGYPYLYPAPIGFFYKLLRFLPHPTAGVLVSVLLGALCGIAWLSRTLILRGLSPFAAIAFSVISVAFSYPLFFEFNRANMEIYIWVISALGILAFSRDRPWLAATLFAFAAACKGYPFIFLGLLFARKQYWQVAYSVVLSTLINYISFWAIAGSFSVGKQGISAGLLMFRDRYILKCNYLEIGLDHSIFGFLKRFWPILPEPPRLAHYLTIYLVIAAIVACALYFFCITRMPFLNQLVFLTTSALLLPPTSYDYTLLHLYAPWAVLVVLAVDCWRKDVVMPRGVWLAMLCFVVLLSPQNEFILHGERIEGQIKCIALLVLAVIALRFPLALATSSKDDATPPHKRSPLHSVSPIVSSLSARHSLL